MKIIVLFLSVSLFFIACNNSNTTEHVPVPSAPSSAATASQSVKGKMYETKKVAILSSFKTDTEGPYEWMNDSKDTTDFFKNYLAERMAFSLQFTNDTSVIMQEEGNTISGTYKFDNESREDEKEGIKLRISYEDSSMSFPGSTEPMVMTYTYLVAGADEKSLLLETPRSFNNRKVCVLMQVK
jgi:hypothetical protein